jgi:HD-GYP domain-containing protein (c-di-GMP phosphodiesterase class II)
MIVAELMTSEDGKAMLGAGTVLTDNRIRLLQQWGIGEVSVLLPNSKIGIEQELPWSFDREAFNAYYKDTVDLVKTAFKSISLFREVPVARMQELANEKIDPLVDAPGVMNHLLMIRHTDDYTFEHSVNVAVLSGVIGKWMGAKGQTLRDLIFAGLMHDIGKSQVPVEILNKPGKLSPTEMEIMKRHSAQGYYLLKEVPRVPLVILWSVLQHHERMDGSGYPLHLHGNNIHEFARIIAVADVYDAMTSDRIYRRRTTPYHVVETLFRQMFDKLDPEVCGKFLYHVKDFMTGNIVMLSDGRQAEIIHPGSYPAGLPLVKTSDGQFLNLEQKRDITIYGLISA